MDLDPVLLARWQFAFVISFHILFPAFTIGLAAWIAVLEGRWLATGRTLYRNLSELWTRIFAISFGMGVVSGIVMSFQFGTNWSVLSHRAGNILGPLLNYEVISAFFLEATFLGILLFGRDRVPRWLHFTAALLIALGTLLSAFWILSANSWMQTPAGFEIRDGIFYPTNWWDVVFNPSFPYRLAHMVTACFLTTAFVVAGVSAWHLLRSTSTDHARVGLSMALGLIAVLAPIQILIGDLHGLNTQEHQPVKVAAMEAHWKSQSGAPLILFAWPDMAAEANRYELAIPKLGSVILKHDPNGRVEGLKEWAPADRPYVPLVFFAFRVMVGLGLIMLAMGVVSLWLRWRGRLYRTRWFLRACIVCIPIGFVALLAGWIVTETGRQPWVVYGFLRTVEAATPAITAGALVTSLAAFVIVYGLIFPAGVYYMVRLVRRGPEAIGKAAEPTARAHDLFAGSAAPAGPVE
ncbi:MAG: cytochrome ubiquinol oxidase subunit I [Geminicoccaceae bacterium]